MTTNAALEQFIDRLGLVHFRGRELTPYWTRIRRGVRNSLPHESLWPNIVPTLIVLDALRERLGSPITLLSTYRSPAYNAAVGGEPHSFHMQFRAIDFAAQAGAPSQWHAAALKLRGRTFRLPGNAGSFVFRGGLGLYRTFVHLDTRGKDADWKGEVQP